MDNKWWGAVTVKLTRWEWAVTAAVLASGGGMIWGWWKEIPPVVPLFYSLPWGEEQLAGPIWLTLPLGLAVGMGLVVQVLTARIKKEAFLTAIILAGSIVSQIILGLAVVRIILLIT